MTIYVEEEQVWKCPKHPSKRRRNGVCPACLRDRLVSLCPDCGVLRPCPCAASTTSSSSSSSDAEPSFRRSRSLAIPFLRSSVKTPSFFSGLMRSKTRRSDPMNEAIMHDNKIDDFARMVTRSRSVSAASTSSASGFRRGYGTSSTAAKSKFWNFPLKAFRSSKVVVQDRSPLQRG